MNHSKKVAQLDFVSGKISAVVQTGREMPAISSEDAAWGSILGAFVGDAAGAVLEFKPVTAAKVKWALTLPGGGVFNVGPGQITDDSELALCIARALAEHDPANGYPSEAVALQYGEWIKSNPFDKGNATTTAFAPAYSYRPEDGPLSVKMFHAAKVCQEANAVYCLAIQHLIQKPGDSAGAYQTALSWGKHNCTTAVLEWLVAAGQESPELPDCQDMIGWCRWGLFYAFYHLYRSTEYVQAIEDILSRGGDTDTNAAIVGGLVGALQGRKSIPSHMVSAVMQRTTASPGQPRPAFLQPSCLLDLLPMLYTRSTVTESQLS